MSDINHMSITAVGKVTINFRPKPLPNPVPDPPSSDEGSSTASTGGQSPSTSQVDPQSQYSKSMVLDAIRDELEIRKREDNRKVMEETDYLYEGLECVIKDLQSKMDYLEWRRARKRHRRE